MKVLIPEDIYKGIADGTSLTDYRRGQILSVYEKVSTLVGVSLTYKSLQKIAESLNIGLSESDARTVFKLLAKLGFIQYSNNFLANQLFTNSGRTFVETFKSFQKAKSLNPQNVNLIAELTKCLANIQMYGILLMNEKEDYNQHGIWLACAILKAEKEIFWSEFLYYLFLIKVQNKTIIEAANTVRENRAKNIPYEYKNTSDSAIGNSTYSYTHALLTEANVITDIAVGHSVIQENKEDFFNSINCNYYE